MNNDLISRSALIAEIEESVVFTVKGDAPSAEMRVANKIIDRIKAAPAVDAVAVCRCKDCKNWGLGQWCETFDHKHEPDFYCSYGERREDV